MYSITSLIKSEASKNNDMPKKEATKRSILFYMVESTFTEVLKRHYYNKYNKVDRFDYLPNWFYNNNRHSKKYYHVSLSLDKTEDYILTVDVPSNKAYVMIEKIVPEHSSYEAKFEIENFNHLSTDELEETFNKIIEIIND